MTTALFAQIDAYQKAQMADFIKTLTGDDQELLFAKLDHWEAKAAEFRWAKPYAEAVRAELKERAELAAYEGEQDAKEWDDACRQMNAAEARWVDNGCSNHDHSEPDDEFRAGFYF